MYTLQAHALLHTYRVARMMGCDCNVYTYKPKKHFKNEQRSKDAAKTRPNTSGVGKTNNYYEDIYIPPYNSTD